MIPPGAAMKKNSSYNRQYRQYALAGLLVCGITPLMEIMAGITPQKSRPDIV
jgi:hypothetical protein